MAPGIPNDHHSRFLGPPNEVRFRSWKTQLNSLFLSFTRRRSWVKIKKLRINFTTFSSEVIGRERNGGVLPEVCQVWRRLDFENKLDIVLILLISSLILCFLSLLLKLVSVPDAPLIKKFVLFHKILISWIRFLLINQNINFSLWHF